METETASTKEVTRRRSAVDIRTTLHCLLEYPNFRYLWLGQLGSSASQWMEVVARGWLVYDMTGSPFMLGFVNGVRAVPLLFFGILGGVLADRFDRKKLLIFSQISNMILNLILALLIVTGTVQVWHVFVTAFFAGCVMAMQQPARQSLLPKLVERKDLMNAVALNSAAMQITRSVGPAIAGFLVAIVGMAGTYFAQAGLLIFASIFTSPIQYEQKGPDLKQASMLSNLKEGFSFVRSNELIFTLLAIALIPMILGMPYSTLMPVFAQDVLQVGPEGLGLLMSAPGIGALIGATVVASLGNFRRKGLFLFTNAALFGITLIVFSFSQWFGLSLAILTCVGYANTSYLAMNNTLLQSNIPDGLQGRVMSIFLLNQGLTPLGTLLVGTLASFFGAPLALGTMGIACTMLAVGVAIAKPAIRRLA